MRNRAPFSDLVLFPSRRGNREQVELTCSGNKSGTSGNKWEQVTKKSGESGGMQELGDGPTTATTDHPQPPRTPRAHPEPTSLNSGEHDMRTPPTPNPTPTTAATTAAPEPPHMALWDRAHGVSGWPLVTGLPDPFGLVVRGWAAFIVGLWSDEPEDTPRGIVYMPTLRPCSPHSLRRRHLARTIANGSGRCPLCRAERAGRWLVHEAECATAFHPHDTAWLDPTAGVAL